MDETVSFIKNAEYLIHWKIGKYDKKRRLFWHPCG